MGIIDSRSLKTSHHVDTDRGMDGNKKIKGRKEPIVVDTLGLPMGIKVHEVNQNSFLRVSSISPHSFEVSFKVRNTGKYDGEEVSQLYLRDEYASVVQPLKQLKYFERFYLKCGEVKEVKFVLSESDFTIIDRNLKTVVEPGTFQIIVGTASNDIRLQAKVVVR